MIIKTPLQKHRLTTILAISLTLLSFASGLCAAGNEQNKLFSNESPLVNEAAEKSPSIEAKQDSDGNFLSFVTVGDPFNARDDQGLGAVNQVYQISKYEITASQYAAFLNSVAWKEDPHGLYHPEMGSDQKVACIKQVVNPDGTYRYDLIDDQRGDLPITYVSLNDAERFCNWLENGSPGRDQDDQLLQQSTESGAYVFLQQGNQTIVETNLNARYHIPSDNEWVKAAYYKGNGTNAGYWMYATQHETAPGNGIGDTSNFANYQTYRGGLRSNFLDSALMITMVDCFNQTTTFYQAHDMSGNVAEWTIPADGSGLALAMGGSWQSVYSWYGSNDLMRTASPKSYDPSTATNFIGFRIARNVPQPPAVTEHVPDKGSSQNFEIESTNVGKNSKSLELTAEQKAFLMAVFTTAATLTGSVLIFITGEILFDSYVIGMTAAEIRATFPLGRIVSICSHLVFNTCAIVETR